MKSKEQLADDYCQKTIDGAMSHVPEEFRFAAKALPSAAWDVLKGIIVQAYLAGRNEKDIRIADFTCKISGHEWTVGAMRCTAGGTSHRHCIRCGCGEF